MKYDNELGKEYSEHSTMEKSGKNRNLIAESFDSFA